MKRKDSMKWAVIEYTKLMKKKTSKIFAEIFIEIRIENSYEFCCPREREGVAREIKSNR